MTIVKFGYSSDHDAIEKVAQMWYAAAVLNILNPDWHIELVPVKCPAKV